MGICFSILRCTKCQHTKFFRCKCHSDRCLIADETVVAPDDGLDLPGISQEIPAAQVEIVDELNLSSVEANGNKEMFEFGKNDEENHEFSFTMDNVGDDPDATVPTLIMENNEPNSSMNNLEPKTFNSSAVKRNFKNKVRRNIVMKDHHSFRLTPTNSMMQVPSSTQISTPTSPAENLGDQKPTRSISGHLSFKSLKNGSFKGGDTPKSSASSPPEFGKLTPKSMCQRLNVSLSPNRKSPTVLTCSSNYPSIFHPSVMAKGDQAGDDISNASDDKENAQPTEKLSDLPLSDAEDEEVEDEQIQVADNGDENSRPKIKRRHKNKQARMRKKARRH